MLRQLVFRRQLAFRQRRLRARHALHPRGRRRGAGDLLHLRTGGRESLVVRPAGQQRPNGDRPVSAEQIQRASNHQTAGEEFDEEVQRSAAAAAGQEEQQQPAAAGREEEFV